MILLLALSVLLQWDANVEPDLAGYSIWRSETQGGGYERVVTLIPCPPQDESCCLYADDTVAAGQRYYYVATAIDTDALESGYSNEVDWAVCLGDVNGDGLRNVLDTLQIDNHIVGNLTLEGNALAVADVNEDGFVNVLDTLLLKNYIVGNVTLPDCP